MQEQGLKDAVIAHEPRGEKKLSGRRTALHAITAAAN